MNPVVHVSDDKLQAMGTLSPDQKVQQRNRVGSAGYGHQSTSCRQPETSQLNPEGIKEIHIVKLNHGRGDRHRRPDPRLEMLAKPRLVSHPRRPTVVGEPVMFPGPPKRFPVKTLLFWATPLLVLACGGNSGTDISLPPLTIATATTGVELD